MTKRSKQRILDYYGLTGLKVEARKEKAAQILKNGDDKQAACNALIGVTFKDIDKVLKGILIDKAPPKIDEEREKESLYYGRDVNEDVALLPRPKVDVKPLLDRDWVSKMVNDMKKAPIAQALPETKTEQYNTYTADQVAELLNSKK